MGAACSPRWFSSHALASSAITIFAKRSAAGPPGDAQREDTRTDLDAARSDLHDALAAADLDEERLDDSAASGCGRAGRETGAEGSDRR